jgi:methylthioxylose transferase
MSKAEVERIWLPFVPWLLLATVCLPARWQRPALAAQVVTALLVQHLVVTNW